MSEVFRYRKVKECLDTRAFGSDIAKGLRRIDSRREATCALHGQRWGVEGGRRAGRGVHSGGRDGGGPGREERGWVRASW